MAGKEIQARIVRELRTRLHLKDVVSEWRISKNATDTFNDEHVYIPRPDIAVGPFNVTVENKARDRNAIWAFNPPLMANIFLAIARQNEFLRENSNPRCAIAIEVEHNTSSKHILGAITNVSMLGRVGVVVGSKESIKKIERIYAYARKLRQIEKGPRDMFGNVGCFSEAEFHQLLRQSR